MKLTSTALHKEAQKQFQYGFAEQMQNRWYAAAGFYRKAIHLDGKMKEAFLNLGTAEFKMGNIAEAKVSYRSALNLDPSYGMAWYNLGLCYEKECAAEKAIECFLASSKTNPKDAATHYKLAMIFCGRDHVIKTPTQDLRLGLAVVHFNMHLRLCPASNKDHEISRTTRNKIVLALRYRRSFQVIK